MERRWQVIGMRAGILWAVVSVPVTVISLLVYLAVQQNFRQNANDPQIQLAEDTAIALASGRQPEDVVPREKVEISKSLAPWLMALDSDGTPRASSAVLDGQIPRLPAGVLQYARQHGQNRVTWQPRSGVRSAIVVRHYDGAHPGFAAAGRSLREVEVREAQLSSEVVGAWLVAIAAALFTCLIGSSLLARLRA